jgi:hypothetical protein
MATKQSLLANILMETVRLYGAMHYLQISRGVAMGVGYEAITWLIYMNVGLFCILDRIDFYITSGSSNDD